MASSSSLPTKLPLHQILDTYHEHKKNKKDAYIGLDLNGDLICKVYEKTIFTSRPQTEENEFSFRNEEGKRIKIIVSIDKAVSDEKIQELTRSLFSYSPQKKESGYESLSAEYPDNSPISAALAFDQESNPDSWDALSSLSSYLDLHSFKSEEESSSDGFEIVSLRSEFELIDTPSVTSFNHHSQESSAIRARVEELKQLLKSSLVDPQETESRIENIKKDFLNFRILCETDENLNDQHLNNLVGQLDDISKLLATLEFINPFSSKVAKKLIQSSIKEVINEKDQEKQRAQNFFINAGLTGAEERTLDDLLNSFIDEVSKERSEKSNQELKKLKTAIKSISIPDLKELLSGVERITTVSEEDQDEMLDDTHDASFSSDFLDLMNKFRDLKLALEKESENIENIKRSINSNSFLLKDDKEELLRLLGDKNNQTEDKRKKLEGTLSPLSARYQKCQERQFNRCETLKDAIETLRAFQGTPLFSIKDGRLTIEKKGLFSSHPSLNIGKKTFYYKKENSNEILKLLEFTSVYESHKIGPDGTPIASTSADLKKVNSRLQPLKDEFKTLLLEKLS